jgi:hypothetical protein
MKCMVRDAKRDVELCLGREEINERKEVGITSSNDEHSQQDAA